MVLRWAIGVVSDLGRLGGEVNAVLDAYTGRAPREGG